MRSYAGRPKSITSILRWSEVLIRTGRVANVAHVEAEAPAPLGHAVLDECCILGAKEQLFGRAGATELLEPLVERLRVVLGAGEELSVHLPSVNILRFTNITKQNKLVFKILEHRCHNVQDKIKVKIQCSSTCRMTSFS